MATDKNEPQTKILWQHFEVIDLIGKGGMAQVFEVHDARKAEALLAAKVLRDDLDAATEEQVRVQFEIEADIHYRISRRPHAHIVPCLKVFPKPPGLLMPLIDGPTLRHLLHDRSKEVSTKRGRLKDSQVLTGKEHVNIINHISDALHYLHQHGVCHCDVKPENILRAPDGNYMLLDFGIAQYLDRPADSQRGTPKYMSPEQHNGEPLDVRTDVYSFGVTIYELFTGQVPFIENSDGSNGVQHTLKHQVNYIQPPPPRYFNRQLNPAMAEVLLIALAKQPSDRYQTVLEFRDALLAAAATPKRSRKEREADAAVPVPTEPSIRARLVNVSDHHLPEVPLKTTNLIGRNRECNVKLPGNLYVSRRHALITWHPERKSFQVFHQGRNLSTRTRINGHDVDGSRDWFLKQGDLIQIGEFKFRYEESVR